MASPPTAVQEAAVVAASIDPPYANPKEIADKFDAKANRKRFSDFTLLLCKDRVQAVNKHSGGVCKNPHRSNIFRGQLIAALNAAKDAYAKWVISSVCEEDKDVLEALEAELAGVGPGETTAME